MEAIFAILAMRDGVMPPTLNLDNPSVETAIDVILSNSCGFGGTNVSLVMRRVD